VLSMLRSTRRVPASTSPEAQEAPECCTPFSNSFRHWVRPLSFNTTCMLVEYADHSFSTLMFPHGLQRKPLPHGKVSHASWPCPTSCTRPKQPGVEIGIRFQGREVEENASLSQGEKRNCARRGFVMHHAPTITPKRPTWEA